MFQLTNAGIWAFRSQVDDDVKHGAARAAHDLALGSWRVLEVHASQRALLSVGGILVAFRPRFSNWDRSSRFKF